MSGQPAARLGDGVAGGVIVQGSASVLIGAATGVACSVCPGGQASEGNHGSPVNAQLGAKVLGGAEELDFALPGPLAVVWQRHYSSYVNREHGLACGALGYGWSLGEELRLEVTGESVRVFATSGRVIEFAEPLAAGGALYSPSEDLHLLRGGHAAAAGWASEPRWSGVPEAARVRPEVIVATSGAGTTYWCFEPEAAGPEASGGQRWRLAGQVDRFGREQRLFYRGAEAVPEGAPPAGTLEGLRDGAGRRYRLRWQAVHRGQAAREGLRADSGWRLVAVELERDAGGEALAAPVALVRYGYNPGGDLVTVHNRAGEVVREFQWEGHRLVAHRHRGGPWHRYRYASAAVGARVVEHASEAGLGYRFEYLEAAPGPQGEPRRASRVTDSLGRVHEYLYEGTAGLERLIEHRWPDGSRTRRACDAFGRLVASTDALGRTTRLARDGEGRITAVTAPDGRRLTQRWDAATGQLAEVRAPNGQRRRHRHDAFGRLVAVEQDGGGTERYTYPEPGAPACEYPIATEDAAGNVRRLEWSATGQLLAYTDCAGGRSHWRYDRWGALVEESDALGSRTRHDYDAAGRRVATHWPGGQSVHYAYDGRGALVRTAAGGGGGAAEEEVVTLERDLWGRLVRRSQGGLTLGFEYDVAGRLVRLVNENGARSRFAWDALDRLVLEEGFDGRLQRYEWDAAGQLTGASDGTAARQVPTRYAYDAGGRITERRLPATEAAPAQVQRWRWDRLGQLAEASTWTDDEAALDTLSTKDPETDKTLRRLTQVRLEHDARGRLTGEVQALYDPDGRIEFEHRIAHRLDALGQRTDSTLQGFGALHWRLCDSGRVAGLDYAGAPLVDFTRDALRREVGRTLHGTAPARTRAAWDALGRLAAWRSEGLSGSEALGPRLGGALQERHYHYNALGQLIGIEAGTEEAVRQLRYRYDPAGRLVGEAAGAGEEQRWRLDPAGNRLPGAAPTAGLAWAARVHAELGDPAFNLLGTGEHAPGPVERWLGNRIGYSEHAVWRYDEFGNRVAQYRAAGARQRLGYDGAHRLVRLERAAGLPAEGCAPSGGALARALTATYTYDALGRRLKKHLEHPGGGSETRYYGWDGDRLVHTEICRPEGPREQIHTVYLPGSFTPLVRLSREAAAGEEATELLQLLAGPDATDPDDPDTLATLQASLGALPPEAREALADTLRQVARNGLPPSDAPGSGAAATATQAGFRQLAERLQAQEQVRAAAIRIHHYHSNHLGTPLALSDEHHRIVWAADLDPWGNLRAEYNPEHLDQPIRLPGQHHDPESGYHYNRFRDYDPELGSYITQDPIGLLGELNKTCYPRDPIADIDYLGLAPVSCGRKCPTIEGLTFSEEGQRTLEVIKGKRELGKLLARVIPGALFANVVIGGKAPNTAYNIATTDWAGWAEAMTKIPAITRAAIEKEAGATALSLELEDPVKYKDEIEFFRAIYEGCDPSC